MRISRLAVTAALCISSTLSISIPAPQPPLPALNPSAHEASALFIRAAPEWTYNVRNTAIKLIGKTTIELGSAVFAAITAGASDFVNLEISRYGDGDALIPQGRFVYVEQPTPAEIYLQNADNHQLTWRVVQAAVGALAWVPELEGKYGAIFKIYDGEHQVGVGTLYGQ